VLRGDRIEITPSELVAGGDAIAKIDGFPVFVRGIFPGDRATVELTEVKKGFARGVLVDLVEPGPLRRGEPCPIADECGGCDWTALRLDHQLDAKVRILRESLRRVGKIDPSVFPPIQIHSSPLNYRLRSRLHVDRKNGLGFFALRSNRVVPVVQECEVLGPGVLASLAEVEGFARESNAGSVAVVEDRDMIVVQGLPRDDDTDDFDGPRQASRGADVSIRVGAYDYKFSTSSFFQVNRHLLGRMLDLVKRHASHAPRRALAFDLYGGVGFFTLPLAAIFDRVVCVESSRKSSDYARMNTARLPNVEIIATPVEPFVRDTKLRPDFVIVDPPRAGIDPAVADSLTDIDPDVIAYMSCDPVTLARDANRLTRRGWKIRSLDMLDLFPNTHHVAPFATFARS
jgi:23S rRNA (uracil1939-C5)-methyltransferase